MFTKWSIQSGVAAAAFGVVALATLPAVLGLVRDVVAGKRRPGGEGDLYEDEDGVATEESQEKYSTWVQRGILCVADLAGAAVGLAAAVVMVREGSGEGMEWWGVGCWFLLLVQTAAVLSAREPVNRFNLALLTAVAHLALTASLGLATVRYLLDNSSTRRDAKHLALPLVELGLALAGFIACITLPRRPDVYFNGKIVDRQGSVSALSRFTYAWPANLLARAATGKQLNIEDLPAMDHHTRAKDLNEAFVQMKRQGRPVKLIVFAHAPAFTAQWVVTVLQGVFQVAPQFAMFKLLRLLEARDAGASVNTQAIFWVLGLGLGMILQTFLENLMWWISYSRLNIPIRVQLSALIFTKSMRRKDVKGVGSTKEKTEPPNSDQEVGPVNGVADEANVPGTDLEENLQKSRQGIVNLIGVDTKRVADFSTYNNLFVGSFFKLAVSLTFLGKLVGWQSLLAGLIVFGLTLPLNIHFSKKYSNAQGKLMGVRDEKLAVLNEALSGIRQIKFSALERQWQKKIQDVRGKELGTLWQAFMADTFLIFCWLIGPIMLSAACIGTYAIIHRSLSASIAFTTIAILSQIEGTLAFVPELTTNLLDALVSLNRVGDYLNAPEKPQNTIPGDAVKFEDATISWPSDGERTEETFVLRDLNMAFPPGELSVISGRTGSGKSLLLAAVLGEVEVLSGKIIVPQAPPLHQRYDHKANKSNWIIPSALAFVSQQPWIENATFRDNILFGLPYDAERYHKVVSACALDKDLEILDDGEMTEIGANGINLSGGQRWRITLARALYSRAGILVMDDIFSAVDAHVGRHIFEQALTGELCQGRTRILVTHHVSLCLPKTKYEVRLGDGKVDHAGFVDELERTGKLQDILDQEEEETLSDEEDKGSDRLGPIISRHRTNSSSDGRRGSRLSVENGTDGRRTSMSSHRRLSRTISRKSDVIDDGKPMMGGKAQPKKFVEEETRKTGKIEWSVYRNYLQASGGLWYWVSVLAAFGGYQGLLLGRSWWLTLWTEHYETKSSSLFHQSNIYRPFDDIRVRMRDDADADLRYYLSVYLTLAVVLCIVGTLRYLWVFYGSIKASRRMFNRMTYAVLRAPLRWLDTVPMGRVLNRFTADFNVIDSTLANATAFMLFNILNVVGIIVAGAIVSPLILIFAIFLLGICAKYALYYLAGARETKRLESVAKSPVFELFSAALSGVATIRAFGRTEPYIKNMFARIDAHAQTSWYMWIFNRWLTWRLSVVGAAFSVAMAGLIVSLESIDAPLGGFALGFTLQYTESVVWMLRQYANVELGMNATERIIEYSEITTEDEGGADAPAAWPAEGRLSVEDLVVGYAPDLPPVLKGLTFSVEKNQRVGVVGRTGAGKSSLTLALFRFLEPRQGAIHIDGLDISKIKLHDLRSRLAIIPQDPVLFSGTVHSNIDPFNDHDDQELRDALERVHLVRSSQDDSDAEADGSPTAKNINVFTSLNSPIAEGGLNLSQGQRQLLCLARAIVARPKIMVLDEATSAVDKSTDELIQRSIREEFSDATLVVIAHRLSTIADFDRILVMSEGRAVEFGTPRELMEKTEGVFRGMVEDSGESGALKEIILGEDVDGGGL